MKTRIGVRPLHLSLPVLAATLVLASCYPGDITSVTELDTVLTVRNPDYDFQQNLTYAMPDFVVHWCEVPVLELEGCLDLSHDLDDDILRLVQDNMAALGYTRVTDGSEPDVALLASVLGSENYVAWVSYPWYPGWGSWPGWGWCPGCWGPGWGTWYPGGATVVRYETGTVLIDMVDPDAVPPGGESELLVVEWNASINGALSSSADGLTRVTDGVNQAFEQSTYLEIN